jgi:glutamate-1-semialdehyde aminotransferase
VIADIWRKCQRLLDGLQKATEESGFEVSISGIAPMPFLTFESDPAGLYKKKRTRFYTEMIRRGVFLAPYHHGYVCWRHTDQQIEDVIGAASESLRLAKDAR